MQDETYAKQRRQMIKRQLRPRGVTDARTLNAMESVPRERFFKETERQFAYSDGAYSIGEGQTISQPYMVGCMTQALQLTRDSRVLEIGTGSGYQTAILAEMAAEVHTIERVPELHERSKQVLSELGYNNIHFHCGDGTAGWPEAAPYDGILVTAGAPDLPDVLVEQLADGGHLVIPVGDRNLQKLLDVHKHGDEIRQRTVCECIFVPLVGEHGW